MAAKRKPTRRCQCGQRAVHALPTCLPCHVEEVRATAFQRGLAEGEVRTWSRLAESGRLRGHGTEPEPRVVTGIALDRQMWRRLAMLSHPDRHDGSEAAHRAMQWLNSIRDRVMP